MQHSSAVLPAPSESAVSSVKSASSLTVPPSITMTQHAQRHIRDTMERMKLPVKGIRLYASPRTALRLDYAIRFVPAEETPSPRDAVLTIADIDVYIDPVSATHLKGATIDYVFRIIGSELKVLVSFQHLDTPEGRLATKVQRVIDEKINPSLGTHGGAASLVDIQGDVIFIELEGGCQGCGMAGATLKEGVESSIRGHVPEVLEVRDITNHANGTNPYFL